MNFATFVDRNGVIVSKGDRVWCPATGFRGVFYEDTDGILEAVDITTGEVLEFGYDEICKDLESYLTADFYAVTPDGLQYVDTALDLDSAGQAYGLAHLISECQYEKELDGLPVVWAWGRDRWDRTVLCGL